MTLGELIKEYRIEHSLSQRQFAVICNLSNGYIAMLEHGENPQTHQPIIPTIPRLKAIAGGMGMTLNDLFRLVDDMPVDVAPPAISPTDQSLLDAYHCAPQEIRDIVNTALTPYYSKEEMKVG